jgi:murein DD-endopeptidase MepM/ murein hydrolase activator NlpD
MNVSPNSYIHPLKEYRTISNDSPSHTGYLEYAEDYDCPEGQEIHAARGGRVVFLKNDSNEGGVLDKKYWNSGNRIVIEHENGEYTAYEHLRYQGAIVSLSQRVEQDEIIGYTGNTGYSSCPHLHFEVFVQPGEDMCEGTTIPINFSD